MFQGIVCAQPITTSETFLTSHQKNYDNSFENTQLTDTAIITDTLLRREVLAVKTNLLFYGVYMPGYNRWCPLPNIAMEYYPKKGHFTYGASLDMPWWQNYDAHKYFQLRNYQVESRYYLKAREDRYAGKRDCLEAFSGWVGEGIGAGVGVGYVMPVSRDGHWRLELVLQAGFFTCKYDPYQYESPVDPSYVDHLYYYKWTFDPSLFKKRQYRWNWVGPTRIGVTLSYDLLYRRISKRGVSFKKQERRGAYE